VVDRAVTGLTTLGIATPEFFLGVLLVAAFAIGLGWLPAVGYEPVESGLGPWLRHLALPWLTLGLGSAAQISRHLRAAMLDVLSQDYIRTARAKGLPEWKVIGKHALKNAAVPVITVVGLQLQALLSGSVIVETVFAIRGLGGLLILSVNNRDIPMIQGIVLLMVVAIIMVNLVVDISYRLLNPKARNG
jgi:peptide/nickel transport system permease protein